MKQVDPSPEKASPNMTNESLNKTNGRKNKGEKD